MATLKNPNVFKGILQYKSTDNFTKETGYMYLIRGFSENGEETGKTEIYFGNRKYGEANVSQTGGLDSILEEINKLAQETANSKPVTYSELKSLRVNGNLIPGQKYRITDYVTVVDKPNIESAGHPFNIIVEALDEYTLSERAKATQDENDGYFDLENLEAWDLWYCLDNDTNRFDWGISTLYDSSSCAINSDLIEGNAFKTPFAFSGCMWNDPINGDEYDSKVENDLIYEWGFEEEPNGSKSLYLLKSDVDIYNEEGTVDTDDKFYYRGVIEADGIEYDYWQKYDVNGSGYLLGDRGTQFVLTERIVEGNIIEFQNGKGIIYRMIDEYGNDCPYDFKNIMFKKHNAEELNDDTYYFTFSYLDGNDVVDASVFCNNHHMGTEEMQTVYSNTINKYVINGIYQLPRNIFISINYDGGLYGCNHNKLGYNCTNNIFSYGCSDNIFGNYCIFNTLGDNSYYNVFGDDCSYNTFGTDCLNNSFGNLCVDNIFSDHCCNNIFGNECINNEFGIECQGNNFKTYCSYNIFGNYYNNNSLGDNCNNNTFGDNCYDNTFGVNCVHNSFGNDYHNNTLGNGCNNNAFGEGCCYNTLGDGCGDNGVNTFGNDCESNSLGDNCYGNTFGNNFSSNSFGGGCTNNSFGYNCFRNSFGNICRDNTFGNDCHNNTFGNECISNSFGNDYYINTFGDSCYRNSFGDNCSYNSFANECYDNSFGNGCYTNTFGNGCYTNTFGNNCNDNSLGGYCFDNLFGNRCHSNIFGNNCGINNFEGLFLRNNYISDGCARIVISGQTDKDHYIQNLVIAKGVKNEEIVIPNSLLGVDYEIKVAKNSSGELKIYCEADLIA